MILWRRYTIKYYQASERFILYQRFTDMMELTRNRMHAEKDENPWETLLSMNSPPPKFQLGGGGVQ